MTEHLELTGDLGDGLRLRKALEYKVTEGEDWIGPLVVAEDHVFWCHGVAETRAEAVLELRDELAALYHEQKLGRMALSLRDRLREYIEEAP